MLIYHFKSFLLCLYLKNFKSLKILILKISIPTIDTIIYYIYYFRNQYQENAKFFING